MQIPKKHMGLEYFFSGFFSLFELAMVWKKESVCDFMSKNFHYEHSKFFQRT